MSTSYGPWARVAGEGLSMDVTMDVVATIWGDCTPPPREPYALSTFNLVSLTMVGGLLVCGIQTWYDGGNNHVKFGFVGFGGPMPYVGMPNSKTYVGQNSYSPYPEPRTLAAKVAPNVLS